jgi:hypothetical protein
MNEIRKKYDDRLKKCFEGQEINGEEFSQFVMLCV